MRAVFSMIDAENFVEPIHGKVFEAAKLAHERYSSTTFPVVARLLNDEDQEAFQAQTGQKLTAYLASCLSGTVYSPGTAAQAAKNVLRQWARLSVAREAQIIREAAQSPEADPTDLIRSIATNLDGIQSRIRKHGRGKTRSTFAEATAGVIEDALSAREKKGITGITTGLIDLDRLTGGLQRKDLVVCGARPSMGKTSFATSVSLNAARAGHGVGIFSLEMDTRKLATRMCSDLSHLRGQKIAYQDLINGSASDQDIAQINRASDEFKQLPIFIEDQSGLTISDIRIKVEAMIPAMQDAGHALDMIVIDHLGKVRPSSRYSGNRTNEIGEITDGLKEIAREYDMAVLLLSQLNRQVESRDDKRPTLADLRDSGAIEQDADCIMFLHREAYYLQREKPKNMDREIERQADLSACINHMDLEVAKQRNGEVRRIDLFVDMAYSAVRNAAKAEYEQGGRYERSTI